MAFLYAAVQGVSEPCSGTEVRLVRAVTHGVRVLCAKSTFLGDKDEMYVCMASYSVSYKTKRLRTVNTNLSKRNRCNGLEMCVTTMYH